jgi:hypothetical protein
MPKKIKKEIKEEEIISDIVEKEKKPAKKEKKPAKKEKKEEKKPAKKEEKKYEPTDRKFGSRSEVWHGTAKMTTGKLTKADLMKNKRGVIVSKKKSENAKKNDLLARLKK